MPVFQAFTFVKEHLENSKFCKPIADQSQSKKKVVDGKQTNMEKDIFEQPESLKRTMQGRVDFQEKRVLLSEVEEHVADILRCKRLIVIGAASSYHVAIGTRQIMEELVELPVFVELTSDFLDRNVPIFRDDVCVFLSQSGETSAILKACEYCKHRDALTMCITNTETSCLAKMTDYLININAGEEYGITSTKTYTSQFVTMVLLAIQLASDKKQMQSRIREIIDELELLPSNIETVLNNSETFREMAMCMRGKNSVLVMGRGYQQASCLEGSLKLKEVTNIHSEGIHSGELKHGPLALIDDEIPIIMIIMRDAIYNKCINALQQVKARNGRPILICEKGDIATSKMADKIIQVPKTVDCLAAVITVVPMQLLSLHLALLMKKDVDQPNGLVKTVVET